ncbi:MAG: CapA family protein [Spirochaetia bacterium]|nr:CapA family protein [Spirochaetia bacterium]
MMKKHNLILLCAAAISALVYAGCASTQAVTQTAAVETVQAEATATPFPVITPRPQIIHDRPGEIEIALTGDIMVGRRIEPYIEKEGIDYPFAGVAGELLQSDIVFGNLESPLVYGDRIDGLQKNGNKSIYLYAQDKMARGLLESGYNILSLANNHTLDYGQEGLKQTMEILDAFGLKYTGVWKGDQSKPNEPYIMEANGVRVGFLCYSRVSNESFASSSDKWGTMPGTQSVMIRDVKNAKRKKLADILIVYIHWGLEGRKVQNRQPRIARELIDKGADLVFGSHTHLFQDIERFRDRYIFYGLGNFIFDMEHEWTKTGAIVKIKVSDKKIKEARVIPLYLREYRPEIMTDKKEISKFLRGIRLKDIKREEIYHTPTPVPTATVTPTVMPTATMTATPAAGVRGG